MKIVSTGNTLSSPEFHEKKRKTRRIRRIIWFVFLATLVVGLIFFSRRQNLLIKTVVVEGAKAVRPEEVESVVKQILSGYYLGLVPHADALVYPRREMKESLMRQFPRFNSLSLSLKGFQTLQVVVTEREPSALYCESAFKPEDAKACYFLDESGLIFDEAPAFSGTVYFIYALDKPLSEPLGQVILPVDQFKILAKFIQGLPVLGLTPLSLEIGQDEFSLVLPHEAKLVWKRDAELTLIHANLEAFLTDEKVKSQKDFLDKLLLLDLRTENKVFWKVQ